MGIAIGTEIEVEVDGDLSSAVGRQFGLNGLGADLPVVLVRLRCHRQREHKAERHSAACQQASARGVHH